MKIEKDTVVTLSYKVADAQGKLLELAWCVASAGAGGEHAAATITNALVLPDADHPVPAVH